MTPSQVETLLGMICKIGPDGKPSGLFPNANMTTDEMQLLGEQLSRVDIDLDQSVAVLRQYRASVTGPYSNRPDIKKIMDAMYGARRAKIVQHAGDKPRNLLVDVYRRRWKYPSHMSDEKVALDVCRGLSRDPTWGEDGARTHLREIVMEFVKDEVEVWRIVFAAYPHAAMQKRVRERIERTRVKIKERDERKAKEQA